MTKRIRTMAITDSTPLPYEILKIILAYTDNTSWYNLSITCKTFYEIINCIFSYQCNLRYSFRSWVSPHEDSDFQTLNISSKITGQIVISASICRVPVSASVIIESFDYSPKLGLTFASHLLFAELLPPCGYVIFPESIPINNSYLVERNIRYGSITGSFLTTNVDMTSPAKSVAFKGLIYCALEAAYDFKEDYFERDNFLRKQCIIMYGKRTHDEYPNLPWCSSNKLET